MDMKSTKHQETISKMTLEQKFRFLTGVDSNATYDVPELGIAPMYCHDSPFGPRVPLSRNEYATQAASAFPNSSGNKEAVATAFPTGCALGATWNRSLLKEVGQAIGQEHKAYGVTALLGPAVNIKRHPLCGRNFEYFAEDPFLSGELGAAYVIGAQKNHIAACPKHYIANNQERGRFSVSSEMDERTMREIYLAPFERIVKKAAPWSIMCAYNRINGVYASESSFLLDDVLRKEWGFDGVIISDWGAVKNRAYSLKASIELCMPYQKEAFFQLQQAYAAGEITDEEIDGAVDRLLTLQDRTNESPVEPAIDFKKHHMLAVQAARESITLLKNDGTLPLQAEAVKRILIIGERADQPFIGGDGSSRVQNPAMLTTPLQEIRHILGQDADIDFWGESEINTFDHEVGVLEGKIAEAAKAADAVIIFANQDYSCTSETMDRNDIEIPPYQEHMIRAAHRVNAHVIVVLNTGSAISTYKWSPCAHAILVSWLGGQGMGRAVAETLFGLNNPSGKLAETFPKRLDDVLSLRDYPGDGYKTEYREKLMVGYRHFDTNNIEPEYPFGFGLSYTSFSYSDLEINGRTVSFLLKNTGCCAGAEIAQVYVSAPRCSWLSHPQKELKGFEKVYLRPQEEKRVVIALEKRDFQYWNPMLHDWVSEPGEYHIFVGSSSRTLLLSAPVYIKDEHKITFAASAE